MRKRIRDLRQAAPVLRYVCAAVTLLLVDSLRFLYAVEGPKDRPNLLCEYPGKPLVFQSSDMDFAAFRNGSKIVSAGSEVVEVWDLTTGKRALSLKHSNIVLRVAIAPDEKTLLAITAGCENPVRLWNLEDGKLLREYPSPLAELVKTEPAGKKRESFLNRHGPDDWLMGRSDFYPETGFGFTSLAFSPTGEEFATGCEDGSMIFWNTKTGRQIACLKGNEKRLRTIPFACSQKSSRILIYRSGTIELWDTKNEALVKQFGKKNISGDRRLKFTADGRQFTLYRADTQTDFDAATGSEVETRPYQVSDGNILSGAGFRVGKQARDPLLEMYDIKTDKVRARCHYNTGFNPHYSHPTRTEYLPDISSVMIIEFESDDNTEYQDMIAISVVPLSKFEKLP